MSAAPPPGQHPHPYPYAAQPPAQPYGPPHPHPQPYGPPGPHPASPWGAVPHPAPVCRICGALPVSAASVRGHQGFLVIMRFLKAEGPFCRTCGIATYRRMTADTLIQGWWGALSAVITPFTLLANLFARASFRKLPPPQGGWRPPLDPGKPVPLRPQGLLFLIPLALVAATVTVLLTLGVVGAASAPARFAVGDCVRNDADWPDQDLERAGCDASGERYEVAPLADCGPTDYLMRLEYSADGATSYCLKRLG
ncbi:LppU/SCO3897 family protein [Streptomyces sp. SYSU K217416]